MRAEKRFDPAGFLAWLDEMGVNYLLIGGQAVRLYGSNRTTVDYDFWFPPEVRIPILEHLTETYELELSAEPTDRRRPIVVAQSAFDKVDLFFVRGLSTPSGRHLDFDDIVSRAVSFQAPGEPPAWVPSIDDLIGLKSLRDPPKATDMADIRFLEVRKASDRGPDGAP